MSPSTISELVPKPLAFLDICALENAGAQLSDTVLKALAALSSDGVLKLLAEHRPDALIRELALCGYWIRWRQRQAGSWDIEVRGPDTPAIADLRELEAPGPMQRVLLAASRLDSDGTYLARLPRVPHPLFPLLQERGLRWWVHEEADHSALLAVQRAR